MQSFGVVGTFDNAVDRVCVSAATVIRQFIAYDGFLGDTLKGLQHVGFCMKKLENQP